jgi:hypothetical protein
MTHENIVGLACWIWFNDNTPLIKRYTNGNRDTFSLYNILAVIVLSVMLPDSVRASKLVPMHYIELVQRSFSDLFTLHMPLILIFATILFLITLKNTAHTDVMYEIFGVDFDDRYRELVHANLKGISAILDSGASLHLFNQLTAFKKISYDKDHQMTFTVANGATVTSQGVGHSTTCLFSFYIHSLTLDLVILFTIVILRLLLCFCCCNMLHIFLTHP